MNNILSLGKIKKRLLCLLIFGPFLLIMTIQKNYGQDLPKVFVEDLSNAIRSVIVSGYDSLDMYTVAVKIAPDGSLSQTFFSIGTTPDLKDIINERLAIATIDHKPLKDYWRKYCIENKISKPVIIIQTIFTRSKNTDHLKLNINELTIKYRRALSFNEGKEMSFGDGIVIWFPIKSARFDNDIHVD